MGQFEKRPRRDFGSGGGFGRNFNSDRRSFHQNRGDGEEITWHDAVCSDCGKACKVKFPPTQNRPVYCDECWPKHRPPRRERSFGHSGGGMRY